MRRWVWLVALAVGCEAPASEVADPPKAAPATPDAPRQPLATRDFEEPEPAPTCSLVAPPPGLIDLRRALPTAIFAIGYATVDNFTGEVLPGYEAPGAWLDARAAAALVEAAEALEGQGVRLIVFDAYRPARASEAMVAWAERSDRIDLISDGWVAPRSHHNRGLAIDVGLADADGEILDLGSRWDHFGPSSRVHAVEGKPLARRLQLRRALVAAGFQPYAAEWWHFSFVVEDRGSAPRRDDPYRCRG